MARTVADAFNQYHQDYVKPQLASKLDATANAVSATKLKTARTITTNLASTTAGSFDGSANITPGVSGILSVAHGGTGTSSGISLTLSGDVNGTATAGADGAIALKALVDKSNIFEAVNLSTTDETYFNADGKADLNKITTAGFYRLGSAAWENNAWGLTSYLLVLTRPSAGTAFQLSFPYARSKMKLRSGHNITSENAVWSDWVEMANVADVTEKLAEKLDATANAVSATKLKTARTITTNLASTTAGSFDGSANITPGVSGILSVAHGGTGSSVLSSVNVGSATKLQTARTITTNLASTTAGSFDGSANITPGVSGILSVAHGGTGSSVLSGITVGAATKATQDGSGNTIASTYATKASPALTGTPTAPTAGNDTDSTQLATTAFCQNLIRRLVGSAPSTLDTLVELATAINNDPKFSQTIVQALDAKLNKTDAASTYATKDLASESANGLLSKSLFKKLSNLSMTLTGDVTGEATASSAGAFSLKTTVDKSNIFESVTVAESDTTYINESGKPDLNLIKKPGYYRIGNAGNWANSPASSGTYYLLVFGNVSANSAKQILMYYAGSTTFIRAGHSLNSTPEWSDWAQVASTAEATTSAAGLMSKTDKAKLDGLKVTLTGDVSGEGTIKSDGTISIKCTVDKSNIFETVSVKEADYQNESGQPDLNMITTPGFYRIGAIGHWDNSPSTSNSAYHFFVFGSANDNDVRQFAMYVDSTVTWVRSGMNVHGTSPHWTAWQKIAFES